MLAAISSKILSTSQASLSDSFLGEHGLSINWNQWDGKDCASAGEHLNPTNEKHGAQDTHPSHLGDLKPVLISSDEFVW